MENQRSGHPLLKKIKRPINRTAPQTSSEPQRAPNSNFSSAPAASETSFEIDNYLDEPALPARNAAPQYVNRVQEEMPEYLDEDTYEREVYNIEEKATPEWLSVKVFALVVCVAAFLGVIAGKLLFAESKVVRNGLQGVVVNNEVPRGRARCGVAERSQGCVLYLMNPQRQEMRAKDFYDLAAQMTGRQRFMIETGNMRYANSKIRPGDIAQLNIPPL